MTFVFQCTGSYTIPNWLVEGISDYVKSKSNYVHSTDFPKTGQGDRWDQGCGITARFVEYCEGRGGGGGGDSRA